MNLEEILKRRAELREEVAKRSAELTVEEMENINKELDELEANEKQLRAKQALDARMASGNVAKTTVEASTQVKNERASRGAKYKLRDGKPISLRSDVEGTDQDGILIPKHLDPVVDALPFNEVSSILDLVNIINLPNGNEYSKAFQVSSDEGAYTLEATKVNAGASDDGKYHEVGVGFDKVTIKRNKITAITYESEELESLPDADYASIVERNVSLSLRKKLAKEIILGDGTGNHFLGLASTSENLNANTYTNKYYDVDEDLLTNLLVDFGGDEDIEGRQVLIMNKQSIKDLAKIKGSDKKPVYNIQVNGNTFTINGYRGVFTAHLKSYSEASDGDIWLVYGNLGAYTVLNFGGEIIETSKEFKFDQGVTAVRGKVWSGGGITAYKAFIRVLKGDEPEEEQLGQE